MNVLLKLVTLTHSKVVYTCTRYLNKYDIEPLSRRTSESI